MAVALAACGGKGPPNPVEYRLGIRAILEEGVEKGEYPGVSCIIGTTSEVLFRENVGRLGRVPHEEPFPVVPLYDLELATFAGITSLLTFSFAEAGYLSLDRPLGEFYPPVRGTDKEGLTIGHLLSRSSRLEVDPDEIARLGSRRDLLAKLLALPLTESPPPLLPEQDGGALLLGLVLESLSRTRLDTLLTEHLFRPAGMKSTLFRPSLEQFPRIAPGEVEGGEYRRGRSYYRAVEPLRGISASAGIFTSAEDLGELYRVFLSSLDGRKTIVSREGIQVMFGPLTPYRDYGPPDPARLRATTFGWEIYQHKAGLAGTVQVSATFARTGCAILLVPADRFYLVFLTNAHHPGGTDPESLRAIRERVNRVLDYALGHSYSAGGEDGE